MRVVGLLCFLLITRAASAAPGLLDNGGFERGDFAHWSLTGDTEYSQVFDQDYDGLAPRGGHDYALLGAQGADGILSQRFTDTAGQPLTVSFWLASNGGSSNSFEASFDGNALMQLADTGAFGWRRFTETVIGTGKDTLSFSFRDDQAYLALDSVRVTEDASRPAAARSGGAIPEPATLLILPALAVLLTLRRRRRRGDSW